MNRLSLNSKNMKFKTVIKLSALAAVLSISVIGCRKGLEKTTPLPGRGAIDVPPPGPAGPIGGNTGTQTATKTDDIPGGVKPIETGVTTGLPVPPPPVVPTVDPNKSIPLSGNPSSWVESADQIFKGETVYFDFDKSTLKSSEVSKVEHVASGMKGLTGKGLRIQGHCDERGTEEYNRSLGERRALAVREALVRAGVDPNIVDTISYGEDRPADPAHNEAAWSKNRRGEFMVIEPPTAATNIK